MDDRGKREPDDLVNEIVEEFKEKYIEPLMDKCTEFVTQKVRESLVKAIQCGEGVPGRKQPLQMTNTEDKKNPWPRTTMIAKRIAIITTGPFGVEVHIDDHPTSVKLGNGTTLPATLRALASKRGSHARGDGVVPVKSQAELVKRIAPMRGQKMDHRQTLRAHIVRLRKAIGNAGLPRGLIETIGDGYRFRLAGDGHVTLDGETVI